jgi:hypothetical protein
VVEGKVMLLDGVAGKFCVLSAGVRTREMMVWVVANWEMFASCCEKLWAQTSMMVGWRWVFLSS